MRVARNEHLFVDVLNLMISRVVRSTSFIVCSWILFEYIICMMWGVNEVIMEEILCPIAIIMCLLFNLSNRQGVLQAN